MRNSWLKYEKENKLWDLLHREFAKSAKNEKRVVINHFTIWTRESKKQRITISEVKHEESTEKRDLQFSQRGS
jgi:hypothetical protein